MEHLHILYWHVGALGDGENWEPTVNFFKHNSKRYKKNYFQHQHWHLPFVLKAGTWRERPRLGWSALESNTCCCLRFWV